MAGVENGSSKNEKRGFTCILECIWDYKSLPALWNAKSKEYSNRQGGKKDAYAILLDKYRYRYPERKGEAVTKKCNSLRLKFRK
jgi:hypothetical protein